MRLLDPIRGNKKKEYDEFSNIGYNLNIIKIPAETRVAECIKDEAGTGASIESGNHICGPICADLIKEQDISKKHTNSKTFIFIFNILTLKFKKKIIWLLMLRISIS